MQVERISRRIPFPGWAPAFVLALVLTGPATAATINVNETADELNSDGDCSLREAVVSANQDISEDACTQGSGGDIILLPPGTYELSITSNSDNGDGTVNDLDLNGQTRIRPSTAGADPSTRVIQPANPQTFDDKAFTIGGDSELHHLTIRDFVNSTSGGAIYQSGPLTLDSVVLRNNKSGGQGGGLYQNRDPLVVERSAFIGNTAEEGGAIYQQRDSAEIRDTTFVRNYTADYTNTGTSGKDGGAIMLAPVNAPVPTTHLDNLTVVRNSAADSGGGLVVSSDANFALRNSIVAANRTRGSDRDCRIAAGASIDGNTGYNLTGSTQQCSPVTGSNSITGADPELARVGVYDGDTDSAPPRSSSPAIDAGECTDSQSSDISNRGDQRDGTRTRNADGDGDGSSACDIGSIERQTTALVVDSTGDSRDQTPGDGTCRDNSGNCTLRAAIDEANAAPDLDEILLPAKSITLARTGSASTEDGNNSGDLDIREAVLIRGSGANASVIDGNGIGRTLHVQPDASTELARLAVTGGSFGSGEGGGILNEGELNLIETSVRGNSADDGGGIANLGVFGPAKLRIQRSTIRNNTANGGAGGLRTRASDFFTTVVNSTLVNNEAVAGSAIQFFGPSGARVKSTTVTGNTQGNALDGGSGELVAHNSIVADNPGGDCGTNISSNGYLMSSSGSNCPSGGTSFQPSNTRLNTPATVGTDTRIVVPEPGSPAVDAGLCTDGQGRLLARAPLGGTRPQDADDATNSGTGDGTYDCDIGAAERQQVRVRAGSNMPAARTVSPGNTDVVMAQFELENESGESLDGLSFTVRGIGGGNEAADVKAVRLYLDNNADGQLDSGDTQIDTTRSFSADNGTVTFDLTGTSSPLMASGGQVHFLVTYDFANQLAVRNQPSHTGLAWAMTLPFGLLPLLGVPSVRRRLLAGLAVMLLAAALAGCGGGNGSLNVAALALILDEDEDDDSGTGPDTGTYQVVSQGVRVEGITGGELSIRTPRVAGNTLTVSE